MAATGPGAEARPPAPPPWSWRRDGAVAALLAAATVGLRLAKASETLYTVDSVLFALATERFDLMALRPHPPGYPLFVALGKALLPATGGDANAAFVLQSALWSGLAVALLYALVRQWGPRRPALAAAALFAVAPAFAFNGTIALSYTAEAAAMAGVALLAWLCWTRPTAGRLLALGAAWALAVGIRQSLFLFLAPLVALAVWGPALRPAEPLRLLRHAATAGAAALLVALAWFLPMAWASGGVAEVRRATRLQSSEVVFADAVWARGWPAFAEHLDRLAYFLHWETGTLLPWCAALALVGLLAARLRGAPLGPAWPAGAGTFLAAWLLPATLFYLLVFDGWERGPIGYVLSLLPGLYALAVLLADQGAGRLLASLPRLPGNAAAAMATVALLVPGPALFADGHGLIAREAEAHDAWAARWQALEDEYPPETTAILAWQSWSHVKWHFPDHLAWTYFPTYEVEGKTDWALVFAMRHREDEGRFIELYQEGPGRPEHPIPPWVETVVVFDFQLAGEGGEERRLAADVEVREAHLEDGWRILALDPAGHPTVESLFTPEALGEGARA